MTKNQAQYTVKLVSQLSEIFNEESENFINKDDFDNESNGNDFFYALNCACQHLYVTMTGDKVDALGYIHIANRLIFQNSQLDKK